MTEKIIILDFGSQVTQLIGRRLRELNVYCEIYPFNKIPALDESVKGVILSGSPFSVREGMKRLLRQTCRTSKAGFRFWESATGPSILHINTAAM